MPDDQKVQERFTQFLRALDSLSTSVRKQSESDARLVEAIDHHTEAVAMLFDAISKEKDGLIAAIDDLREEKQALSGEIAALRGDLRQFTAMLSRALAAIVRR